MKFSERLRLQRVQVDTIAMERLGIAVICVSLIVLVYHSVVMT